MPTPFYHLSLAEELLELPGLPAKAGHFLQAQRNEFLLGNTAPDVQVLTGQLRESTHFFCLPILEHDRPAWETFLSDYPQLAEPASLPPDQAAFVAGYLCHLQADWLWIKQIFAPVFGPSVSWGSFEDRLYYHNALRAYLDRKVVAGLGYTGLNNVSPAGWLPFVQDCYLVRWRDYLSRQLEPGAFTQTVEVFSSRQGVSAPEFYDLISSEERMQCEVFEHVSMNEVMSYRSAVLDENISLLSRYLASALHPKGIVIEGNLPQGAYL